MNIIQDYIKTGTLRRPGTKLLGVKFVVAHDTGNKNTTARQNVNYFKNSANEASASAHVFVDDIEAIECIPMTEKAWHVWYSKENDNKFYGGDSNDYAIGVELCFFDDKSRTLKAYYNYVEIIASLFDKYGLDPLKNLPGHDDLDPERKTDPMNAFKIIGKTKEEFRKDVRASMKTNKAEPLKTCKIGQVGPEIAAIQKILEKGGYVLGMLQTGVYDEIMAKSVLYFQLKNNVADIKELSILRGETVGPKTIQKMQ